ncbi:MAG: TolC family protein [Proteobacteria bacterium]|nr:TolC family protein [Pseudomonadota bacterium]MBU1715671.1 TolC family protein [Pseudomonadota bacterium]
MRDLAGRYFCFYKLGMWANRPGPNVVAIFAALLVLIAGVSPVNAAEELDAQSPAHYSLAQSLKIAEANSLTLKNLPRQMLAAELNSENVDLDKWPALNLSVDYELGNKTVVEDEYGRLKPYLTLTQEILGKVDVKYAKEWAAMTKKMDAEANLSKIRRDLFLEVAQKYYTLLLAQMKYEQEANFFAKSQLDLQEAKSKYEDGLISKVDVIRAETNFSYSSLKQLSAQNELEYAAAEFVGVLNLPRETKVRTEPLDKPPLYTIEFEKLKDYAERHNAELAIYDKVIEQLPRFRSLAKKINWPTVSMAAFWGEGSQGGGKTEPNEDDYGLRVSLTQPIFDYGIKDRKRQILELEIDELEAAHLSFRNQYYRKLDLLLKQFTHAGLEVQQLKIQAEQDMALAEIGQRSYELGMTSYTDMLQNRDLAQKSEYRYAAAITKYLMTDVAVKLNAGLQNIDALFDQTMEWPGPDQKVKMDTEEKKTD